MNLTCHTPVNQCKAASHFAGLGTTGTTTGTDMTTGTGEGLGQKISHKAGEVRVALCA